MDPLGFFQGSGSFDNKNDAADYSIFTVKVGMLV